MLVNVVLPTGLTSARAYFNYDWITLLVMAVVTVAGVIVFFAAHRGLQIGAHMIDTDAPGYRPPPESAPEPGETSAETQSAARHGPEGS